MLAPPSNLSDVLALADWLELCAFTDPDGSSSRGDLESALVAPGLFEREDVDRLLDEVFDELDLRSEAAEEGYPFLVSDTLVRMSAEGWAQQSSYLFCLSISYFRGAGKLQQGIRPERVFEVLCRDVAGAYVGGDAVRFGAPRNPTELPRSFVAAVDALCRLGIEEGVGMRRTGQRSFSQDGGVDIVAWRHERDRLPGKLVLFGACAAGADWTEKFNELQPLTFIETWLKEPLVSRVLRAFFVPHRVVRSRWTEYSRAAGILFDRCRIACWCRELPNGVSFGDGMVWVKAKLAEASE